MSRRYGRNQKRRHRQLVAMLRAAVAQSGDELVLTRNTLKRTRQKLDQADESMARLLAQAKESLDMLRKILPNGHIALPPDQPGTSVDVSPGEPVLVREEEFWGGLDLPGFDPGPSIAMTVSLQAMQTLAIRVDQQLQEDPVFRKQQSGYLHCYLRMGRTAELCYGISTNAIEWLTEEALARLLHRQITPLLAEKLAAALKNPRR